MKKYRLKTHTVNAIQLTDESSLKQILEIIETNPETFLISYGYNTIGRQGWHIDFACSNPRYEASRLYSGNYLIIRDGRFYVVDQPKFENEYEEDLGA